MTADLIGRKVAMIAAPDNARGTNREGGNRDDPSRNFTAGDPLRLALSEPELTGRRRDGRGLAWVDRPRRSGQLGFRDSACQPRAERHQPLGLRSPLRD
jgi:hypothetical protein